MAAALPADEPFAFPRSARARRGSRGPRRGRGFASGTGFGSDGARSWRSTGRPRLRLPPSRRDPAVCSMGSSWTSVCSTAPSIPLRNCFGSSTSAPTPRMRRARSVWEPRCSGRLAVVATRVPLCSTNSCTPGSLGWPRCDRPERLRSIESMLMVFTTHPALVEFSYHPVDDPAAVQTVVVDTSDSGHPRTPDLSPSSPTPAVLLPAGTASELFRPHRRGSVTPLPHHCGCH